MRSFFFRFDKYLLVLTIVIVLAFQWYWLQNSYLNKKTEILEQTKLEIRQVLVNQFVNNLSLNPKIDSLLNHVKVDYDKITQSQSGATVLTTTPYKGEKFQEVSKKILLSYNKADSLIYHSLKKLHPELFSENGVTIYRQNSKGTTTYPKNRTVQNKNTTEPVASLIMKENITFRAHIDNLSSIIISQIWKSIAFSIFYIILFIGTISLFIHNITINRKLLKNKEIFTQNMTHELKIPISTIMVATDGLVKYDIASEPEAAKKYAGIIQRAATQLYSLVETILQHAKADSNYQKQILSQVNLVTLIEEVVETISGIILKNEAKIIFNEVDEKINLKGNSDQLKQIFLNLIDNSLKYSDKAPIVMISAKQIQNRVLIYIKDNGIGIPDKYAEEIFEPYFRISENDLHDRKGFGLGLSFARNSLKNQGGSIKVIKSHLETGTLIEINMPSYES